MRGRTALVWAFLLSGCFNSREESRCELCRPPDDAIIIESGGASVSSVRFSGTACTGAGLYDYVLDAGPSAVWDALPAASQFTISPLSVGRCEVVVQLEDGTSLRQVFELRTFECCIGIYATGGARWILQSPVDAD
jgi:hypothetical protein